jgi:hypothetical protein
MIKQSTMGISAEGESPSLYTFDERYLTLGSIDFEPAR